MLEAIQDWIGGVALAITTGLGSFLVYLSRGHHKHAERMAVLEHQAKQVPDLLSEIRDEVRGMREDGRVRQSAMYDHIDKVRLELKADMNAKVKPR